jgi:hypothetical protein
LKQTNQNCGYLGTKAEKTLQKLPFA